ncbi:MAG: hypothetical protein J7502_09465 [Flavisolibacter sp.]|nr:hypothetical protein [Flavisolibacter sp.]
MDLSSLTNYQLYEIIQNIKLDTEIRKAANNEFNNRKLSVDEIQEIVARQDAHFQPDKDETLKLEYKLLLILFPFVIPVQSVFAGKCLAKGHKRKWKEYWFYLSLGYLFWTIIVILIASYFLFKPSLD